MHLGQGGHGRGACVQHHLHVAASASKVHDCGVLGTRRQQVAACVHHCAAGAAVEVKPCLDRRHVAPGRLYFQHGRLFVLCGHAESLRIGRRSELEAHGEGPRHVAAQHRQVRSAARRFGMPSRTTRNHQRTPRREHPRRLRAVLPQLRHEEYVAAVAHIVRLQGAVVLHAEALRHQTLALLRSALAVRDKLLQIGHHAVR
mmetsp:Transcript_39279/g.78157  ORF Transcript_39279/g.78157 Transcript_39279/m.78157 type:complete len:201 (-) Transcript_39279:480-1082(-)